MSFDLRDISEMAVGVTNDTTHVSMVSAPAANHRRLILGVTVSNLDTLASTPLIVFNKNGTRTVIGSSVNLAADGTFDLRPEGDIVLADTDESLEVVLKAAITTTQLDWKATFAELEVL
jgi:hypothetical protein